MWCAFVKQFSFIYVRGTSLMFPMRCNPATITNSSSSETHIYKLQLSAVVSMRTCGWSRIVSVLSPFFPSFHPLTLFPQCRVANRTRVRSDLPAFLLFFFPVSCLWLTNADIRRLLDEAKPLISAIGYRSVGKIEWLGYRSQNSRSLAKGNAWSLFRFSPLIARTSRNDYCLTQPSLCMGCNGFSYFPKLAGWRTMRD